MSEAGYTKSRILEMLKEKSWTMTDISKKLNLAPSTVTQHLQEMENAGTIKLVRSRKLKYYEVNEYPSIKTNQEPSKIRRYGRFSVPFAIILILTIFGLSYYVYNNSIYASAQQVYIAPGAAAPPGSTVFTISDAPAPTFYNITALFITVDNVSIHSSTTGKWYNIPLQKSTFNLIQLNNISSILSGVQLNNGTYNELILHISKVEATSNGTNQSVFLPSNSLKILGNFNISNNQSTNWINIDFDLAHSLHIAPNGDIILLPVLNIRHRYGCIIMLNQSSIIISNYFGKTRAFYEFGMNANGIMTQNYTTPQNWSISQNNGRLEINETGAVPIVIRNKHEFIIGGDAHGFLWNNSNTSFQNGNTLNSISNYTQYAHFRVWNYGNANVTANNTYQNQSNSNWNKTTNLNVIVHGQRGFNANCIFQNGIISCNANRSISPADIATNINNMKTN